MPSSSINILSSCTLLSSDKSLPRSEEGVPSLPISLAVVTLLTAGSSPPSAGGVLVWFNDSGVAVGCLRGGGLNDAEGATGTDEFANGLDGCIGRVLGVDPKLAAAFTVDPPGCRFASQSSKNEELAGLGGGASGREANGADEGPIGVLNAGAEYGDAPQGEAAILPGAPIGGGVIGYGFLAIRESISSSITTI